MKLKTIALAGVTCLLAAPVLAHHSFSMFNYDKTLELTGVVKDFQWTNPHSWLQITVTDAKGQTEWSLEMSAPGGLARQGWKPKTVVAGDKVTVHMHPLKDGMAGGQFLSIILPNGKKLGQDASVQ